MFKLEKRIDTDLSVFVWGKSVLRRDICMMTQIDMDNLPYCFSVEVVEVKLELRERVIGLTMGKGSWGSHFAGKIHDLRLINLH